MGEIKLGNDGYAEFRVGENFSVLAKADDNLAMAYAWGLWDFLQQRWDFSCEEEVYLKVTIIRKCIPNLALSKGTVNFTLKNNGEKGSLEWMLATYMFNVIYLNYLLLFLREDKDLAIKYTKEQLESRIKLIESNSPIMRADLMSEVSKFSRGILVKLS